MLGCQGTAVANASASASAVLGGHNNASAGDANKLATEVSKADPWTMIDKIKNATATDTL
ncbi:hypothetical protein A7978_05680 (plasmid) [Borrelia turicatae]|uniref:Variable large protein n=1 Tax=Borrelia turicatae TaxID=142 RepID=A0A172XD95_BORTU|nr:hypothetical protein A7978_05680 [Borrelia turicatae]